MNPHVEQILRDGMSDRRLPRRFPVLVVACLLLVVLPACSSTAGGGTADSVTSTAEQVKGSVTSGTPEQDARVPCEDGRLLISDLPFVDDLWSAGLETAQARAAEWHDDSRLVGFRVSCGLFETGFRWQATYYSAEAQALFAADTRESNPLDIEPEDVPSLDLAVVSFAAIREALLSVDYADENELEPSTGVDIRVNAEELPFGPREAPSGATIAHVSIAFRGEIKDLFINTETSEIFQFSPPSG